MIRRWNLLPQDPSGQTELAAALSISKITAQILLNRGIREVEEARRFFACSLGDLPDPFGMKDMDRATDRLLRAIEGGETIVIYGDYDVDGITGASLLKTFFREIGVETPFYTPDRLKEGYGVNPASVRRLAERGTRVIITVDCGISAFEGLEEARRLGIDLIVTDHHLPPPELPPAAAILNPQRKDCPFPCKALAGVGVAFNLAIALRSRLRERGYFATRPEPNLKRFLDFVAVGTVADIVPLVGANRVMVRHGLAELSRTRRKGFQALVRVSGLEGKEITTGRVGFQLGPRINATGRVGESLNGVRLLTAEDEGE
ncbi:MAG: single-stranded-DNA-specific exonuclease RecJ, partial [Deltaproteobacteria bacterium]